MVGGLLLWAAFPPLGCWPLAWIAPVFWLMLVDRPVLPGRRPYLVLWIAGLVHWLLLLQGIRLAHWATYFGWVALSMYLAVYLPLFVGLARLAVHRFRWPLIFAAPVVWTALELVRGHLLTGFSLGLLGHSQVTALPVIQIADVAGAYGVSFLVMLVAACLWTTLSATRRRRAWVAALVAAISLSAVVGYGLVRTATSGAGGGEAIQVALIQSSAETVFEYNPQRNREIFHDYRALSLDAARRHPELDLMLWPESVYTANVRELLAEPGVEPPAALGMKPREFERAVQQWRLAFEAKNQTLAEEINAAAGNRSDQSDQHGSGKPGGISLLVGTDVEAIHGGGTDLYNTAMLLDPAGAVEGRYFKMHPVMFGEYVPLGAWFPWLYDLTPLGQGLTAGQQPQCFEVGGVRLAPSICFECTVPHLIRRQFLKLQSDGTPPDVLVSVTNDGWFHGSAILDLHLTCAVFRAVEHRRPMLIAANTGISAHVNANGVVEQRLPPLTEGFLICEVGRTDVLSWYTRFGDLPALLCLLLCGGLVAGGVWRVASGE